MYSLPDYGRMLGESSRFGAYRRALLRAVRPGDVVIDLGAGPGVFALLAARAGAAKVYAVEPDPVVELAAELARCNGLGTVEIVPKLSTGFALDRAADVLISDLRGVLPTFTEHLPSIIDARTRLLKPGGLQIPQKDVLWAAPICAPDARRRHLGGFAVQGLDLTPAARRASHLWTRVELPSHAVAARPSRLVDLDYRRCDSPHVKGEASFDVDGRLLDGFAVWFDAEIDDEESYSNAPSSTLIYGQAFFPFEEPLRTRPGDHLHLRFRAHHTPGDDYLYRWAGTLQRGGDVVSRFDQSTFNATFVTAADVAARAPSHRPRLGLDGRIDGWILGRLDGETSLGDVAALLVQRHPESFADLHAALRRVSRLADRYGDR